MTKRIIHQVVHVIVVILVVTFGVQLLLDFIPGSPAQAILGESAAPDTVAAVNAKFGLDEPLPVRYANWLGGIVTADFGTSYRTSQPVRDAIFDSAAVSVEVAVGSLALALAIAIPLALAAASRQGRVLDRATTSISSAVISIPSFMLAVVLLYIFAVSLKWFDVVSPWVPFFEDPIANLKLVILPILALAIPESIILTRVLRSDLVGTLQQDFMLAAKAKGLSRRRLMWRHALRPSSFSLMTVSGLALGRLFGGAIVVETIFSLPGLGRLLVTSIQGKDLPMVLGIVTFVAVVYVVVNAIIDIAYGFIDPRVTAA
ncbi:MAG: ABC transporter permease [Ilumatobacteraceae bacterium]